MPARLPFVHCLEEQKKHQDKPEVPQGEPRTGPKQDQLTVAQCNEQFEKRNACEEIYIWICFMESFITK